MKQILITGATGNIGSEVVRYLAKRHTGHKIVIAVRNTEEAKRKFENYSDLSYRPFDFEDSHSFQPAFDGIQVLFLLRPPHISQIKKVFQPLLESAKENGITNVVFLSVQGAEKSKVIPHNKIERLIKTLGFNFIFVRPSYFMQNLTTTLRPEIVYKRTITLPSGKAKFNWVDVENIGEACAKLILEFEKYQNKPYEITGTENKDFYEVAKQLTDITGVKISYNSLNPIRFYFKKRREGVHRGLALVMTVLHFLPRFQDEPRISDNFKKLTGREPTTISKFIEREKTKIIAV